MAAWGRGNVARELPPYLLQLYVASDLVSSHCAQISPDLRSTPELRVANSLPPYVKTASTNIPASKESSIRTQLTATTARNSPSGGRIGQSRSLASGTEARAGEIAAAPFCEQRNVAAKTSSHSCNINSPKQVFARDRNPLTRRPTHYTKLYRLGSRLGPILGCAWVLLISGLTPRMAI